MARQATDCFTLVERYAAFCKEIVSRAGAPIVDKKKMLIIHDQQEDYYQISSTRFLR
jgi:hypothetical protein